MTHTVLLQDILPEYYSYMRHIRDQDPDDKIFWQLDYPGSDFEEKWFTSRGMRRIKLKTDGKAIAALEFDNEELFIFWCLRWT